MNRRKRKKHNKAVLKKIVEKICRACRDHTYSFDVGLIENVTISVPVYTIDIDLAGRGNLPQKVYYTGASKGVK